MDNDISRFGHVVHHGSNLYREMHKDATDKGEIDVSEIQHHHHVEIGVSLQSHQHKSIPSSSTQPEGTSKSSLDGDEIKNYINKCDVNGANKDTGHEDNFENGDSFDLQALEDVNLTAKEDVTEVNLKNQKSTDVIDVQVRELQALKSKAPAKRERKNSRVLRSPYMSKYSSGYKDAIDIDKEEKLKYDFDGYNINQDLPNELMIDYSQWIAVGFLKNSAKQLDFVVAYPQTKNWFNLMSERKTCWNDEGFCMPAGLPWYMVDEVYVPINCDKDFQWVLAVIVLKERLIRVYDSLSNNGFYDKTEGTDWASLEAYKGKITQQTGLVNEIPFDVDYVEYIPQQASDSLDCGIFVCVYAEILSEGLQVHSCGFDSACQRAHYASLLWHYGVKKANEGCTSDNGDPPRPRKSVIKEIEANAIVTIG
ncbi:hypothetical protein CQW23_01066 [Capsicum baccatum]|uniref:Ubiquitin-like protease family profile domain-containing protein n=1 Tax=Capsicum baccatum TaxID=33114 RepID=A0A2G2XMI8_CAPBA|nr:hypothetical protein CQW23_01066 [Capsicum baccatum]